MINLAIATRQSSIYLAAKYRIWCSETANSGFYPVLKPRLTYYAYLT
jgi:hypothetical protein